MHRFISTKGLPLPLPTPSLDPDNLPDIGEVMHWSTRLTHAAIIAGVAVAVALAAHFALFSLLRRLARRSGTEAESVAAVRLNQSVRWLMVGMALSIVDEADKLIAHVWGAVAPYLMPAFMGWVLYALVATFADLLSRRAGRMDDVLAARSRQTRIALLSRSMGFVIVFLTLSLVLLGVPAVRHVGASLLASAGLIGIAVGAAAQPALKSLIAGLQVAITEPIRIGDYVVVENESGRVEDIRLSYVVIRTGDERRIIVPTTKFLDASFQNWTRVGGITGSVLLPIRPGFPVAPIRAAFLEALGQHDDWDQRSGSLMVSEARVGSVELKLIMSAREPTQLANLRQDMRETMLEWLRVNMADALCLTTSG